MPPGTQPASAPGSDVNPVAETPASARQEKRPTQVQLLEQALMPSLHMVCTHEAQPAPAASEAANAVRLAST